MTCAHKGRAAGASQTWGRNKKMKLLILADAQAVKLANEFAAVAGTRFKLGQTVRHSKGFGKFRPTYYTIEQWDAVLGPKIKAAGTGRTLTR
jgi:hypothetical protein